MTPRSRFLWTAGLLAGIFFCIGFLASFQLPKVRSWVLVKIDEISDKHLPVRILPKNVRLSLIPLGATFEHVRIQPKPEFAKTLDPLVIESVTAELSVFQLVQGRLRLRDVGIKGTAAAVRIPKAPESDTPPLAGLFEALALSPVSRLRLEDVDLKLESAEPRLTADIRGVNASAEIVGRSLAVELAAGSTAVKDPETNALVRVQIEANAYLEPDAVTISAFKLRRGDSYMLASGVLKGDTEALRFGGGRIETRASLHLESMRNWLVRSFPKFAGIPPLKGRLTADARLGDLAAPRPQVEFSVSTVGLYESRFFIDRVEAKGKFQDGLVTIPKLTIANPGARIALSGLEITVPRGADGERVGVGPPAPARLKFASEISGFELHAFLKTLGLPEGVPVWMDAKAKTDCEGTIAPRFRLGCRGSLDAENLYVNETREAAGATVALPKFASTGEFTVEATQVSYKAEIRMPKSTGRSQGVIDYDKGFKISYEADNLDFADQTTLAGLKLEGAAKVKGVTEGDSHSAWMKLSLDGRDIWFEDYWLGDVKGEVGYKSGILSFGGLTGNYAASRYGAGVAVDVRKRTMTAHAKIPFFDAKDLLKVFSRRVTLPFALTGTGKADAKVWGPLEFNRLSYDLRTTVFRGSVAREPFDQAHFDVRSRGGEVVAERVMIAREESTITLQGMGHPDGNIKTLVRGRGLRLEDSTNVSAVGLNLSGVVDFDMDVAGHVLGPSTDLRGTIVKSAIGDQGVPDSSFRLKIREHTLEGGGAFLGDLVEADFVLPFKPQAPFRLDLRTRDWNFAPLFGAITGPGAKKDYDGKLTSDIRLSSQSGGFWNSSGTIHVPTFQLRRGSLQMAAPQPVRMTMREGRLEVQNFFLEGEGTFLRVAETARPVSKVDLQVNGKVDLNLMALMMPFFEEIRGLLSFAFNLRAGPENTDILGSVYVDKGYLKLFGFPHSFEEIKGDFLFNRKKILVNSLKANLSGGRVSADGSIELKGPKNYPILVNAFVDNAKLNIPEGITTTGSGRLTFSGSWFPFLMKGVYDVKSGLVEQLTGGAKAEVTGLQRSTFLPPVVLRDSFAPIEMDLQVNIPTPIDVKASIPVIDLGIDGRASGKLSIKGPPDKFSLLGSVTADRDAKAIFRENIFELTSGVVNFNDPNQINPNLYVTARSRVSGYDVTLVYQGTLNKPDLLLSSSPALSEPDIMSLLAFGTTGQTEQSPQPGNRYQMLPTSVINANPVNNQVKKITGFDVSASVDDVNSVAVPKITASRKFTPKFGVRASQSLGNTRRTEAKAEYQLSRGVSIVGSWEGQDRQEAIDATARNQENQDKFGLDLEYRFEFK